MDHDSQFNNLFLLQKRNIHNMSVKYHKRSGVPLEEFVSQLNEELWFAYRDYDEGKGAKLTTWIAGCLKRRAHDVIREREGSYCRRVTLFKPVDNSDDDAPTSEIADPMNLEDYALRKKEADQRQLIDSLVNDPSQVDPITTLIVAEFPKYKSITALAKALGLHHEVVKRKLTSLSRRYDANRFGDVRDYLAG